MLEAASFFYNKILYCCVRLSTYIIYFVNINLALDCTEHLQSKVGRPITYKTISYHFTSPTDIWCSFCRLKHSCASACKTNTTQNQPHEISNPQRTENKTTDVVIHQQSRKLLMMDILMSETCWARKKWNKIASDIKLVLHSYIYNALLYFKIIWFMYFAETLNVYMIRDLSTSCMSSDVELVASNLSSILLSIAWIRRQFQRKTWPIHSAFLPFLHAGYSFPPRLYAILHFSHDRSKWSFPSLSRTTFQTFPHISDLFSQVTATGWKPNCSK